MSAMSVDMDTAGNTSSVVGPIESCARLDPNATLDADETATDTLTVDVTAEGVPAYDDGGTPADPIDDSGGIIGDGFIVGFDAGFTIETNVVGTSATNIIARNAGSSVIDAGDTLPDSSGAYDAAALDTSASVPEDGDGVLHRITISATGGPPTNGLHMLLLTDTNHLDAAGTPWIPNAVNNGSIAVNQDCPV
jgi:hypothetical protein